MITVLSRKKQSCTERKQRSLLHTIDTFAPLRFANKLPAAACLYSRVDASSPSLGMNDTDGSSSDVGHVLGRPRIRVWEIDPTNSTRYDKLVAAPSDDVLTTMWISWAAFVSAIFVFVLVVFCSILSKRKTRKSAFNCYLLYLMVPDLVLTSGCLVTCALNASVGHFYSINACLFQGWYVTWGIGANIWLNAVIAHEVWNMLRSSHVRRRYFPPTRTRVTLQAGAVYLFMALLASLALIGNGIPHRIDAEAGMVCVPLEYDRASTLFFWLVFLPLFALLPIGYTLFIFIDVYRRNLLPPRGRRRLIGLYFFRIMAVFIIMWVPVVLFFYAISIVSPWVVWTSSAWAHAQGIVSATLSLNKPDVHQAFREFVSCKCVAHHDDQVQSATTGSGSTDSGMAPKTPRRSSLRAIVTGFSSYFFATTSDPTASATIAASAIPSAGGRSDDLSDNGKARSGMLSVSLHWNSSSFEHPHQSECDDVPIQDAVTFEFVDEHMSAPSESNGSAVTSLSPDSDLGSDEEAMTGALDHPDQGQQWGDDGHDNVDDAV